MLSNWIVIGHSLGASRANVVSALGVKFSNPPLGVFKFGEPKTGFGQFNILLQQLPQNVSLSYRNSDENGHDPVTDVPLTIPDLFPYAHPWPLIDINGPPQADDPWGPFKYHHSQLYQVGITKLSPISTIASISALDAIGLVNELYETDQSTISWDHYDPGQDDGVVWSMKIINGIQCFVFRGSQTLPDFVKDGEAVFWNDRDIGPVELGFLQGMKDVWMEMASI